MLMVEERARLRVVLVGARNPSNIGAAARAMHDFGFGDLRVVNAYAAAFEAAQLEDVKSAVAAASVMRAAQRTDALLPAIAECELVVGTTAIGERGLRQPVLPVQQVAGEVRAALAAGQRVAVLFGSEKTGLTTEQLSHCQRLTTIPMYQPLDAAGQPTRHLSMNLGQSVAVCLYELTREGLEGARVLPELHEAVATAEDRERLCELLQGVMQSSGYARRYPHNARPVVVRQLAARMGLSHAEAMTWMGLLRQLQWRLQGEEPEE